MKENVYFLARVWLENLEVNIELHNWTVFIPELILNLKENHRPIQNWYEESFTDYIENNPESFIPPKLEICQEPIWLEVIGAFNVIGSTNYYGEYDEDIEFDFIEWTIEIDSE